MKDEGVLAARAALLDERPTLIDLGARVLLGSGRGVEIERVAMRLLEPIGGRIGPGLLDALIKTDPVHASPTLLCALLDHKQASMRHAASRHLEEDLGTPLLNALVTPLRSKRASTRAAAIDLISRIEGSASLDLLLEHLDDSSPTVCDRVLDALVRRDDKLLDVELLKRAFSGRYILRPSAYALLAVMDREDHDRRSILDERHARSLLVGLGARDPLISGACAAALAGIGFRAEASESTAWLDAAVPTQLVATVSGANFHPDYASLQPRALRRLELISGERIGSTGRAWVDWWLSERDSFHADRAPFPIKPEEVPHLVLRHRSAGGVFTIAGFDAAPPEGPEERTLIGVSQLDALVKSLRESGVLSVERLPGVRGKRSASEREISLRVGENEKTFIFGEGEVEEWFTSIEALLFAQRERQRWQRFASISDDARGSWQAEVLWWETERNELARALRMKRIVLDHLQSVPPSQRRAGLAELERVLSVEGAGTLMDLDPLLRLIEEEAFYSERSKRLTALARELIRGDDGHARSARARVARLLVDHFGEVSAGAVAGVLSDMAPEQLIGLVDDERSLLRALIAAHLSGTERRDEQALLLALLEDEDSTVEAAAVASLGHVGLEGSRTELLIRARFAEGIVRQAALEACGRLGGEGVRQALVSGLAERDAASQLAALKGLAHLKDPESISLFVSYLQHDETSPLFAVALAALEGFGPASHDALLRIAQAKLHKARRVAALVLARAGVGTVADSLASILQGEADAEVALELALLTCFDLRSAESSATEYSAWLRAEPHRDSWRWFVEATARRELECPPRSAFEGGGTQEAALFLYGLISEGEVVMAERARRELGRLLGVELLPLPTRAEDRELWLEAARALMGRASAAPGGEE